MKTIYLHVGNFKTGTSAIQKFCSVNRRRLLEHGFDYIEAGRPKTNTTNHSALPLSLAAILGEYLPAWYTDKADFSTVAANVRREVNDSACKNIILSSEEFYRFAGYKESSKKRAKSELRNLFPGHRVKVIQYVREPMEFSKSWYDQVNKGRLPQRRFTDFFYFLNRNYLLPQYNSRFWRSCFGPECLVIKIYNKDPKDHIRRFTSIFGLDLPRDMILSQEVINSRRNALTMEKERIDRILSLTKKADREKYLRSFVLSSRDNFSKLRRRIKFINSSFARYCSNENLNYNYEPLSLPELLIHEEYVNRKDVIYYNTISSKIARLRSSRIARRLKAIRSMLSKND